MFTVFGYVLLFLFWILSLSLTLVHLSSDYWSQIRRDRVTHTHTHNSSVIWLSKSASTMLFLCPHPAATLSSSTHHLKSILNDYDLSLRFFFSPLRTTLLNVHIPFAWMVQRYIMKALSVWDLCYFQTAAPFSSFIFRGTTRFLLVHFKATPLKVRRHAQGERWVWLKLLFYFIHDHCLFSRFCVYIESPISAASKCLSVSLIPKINANHHMTHIGNFLKVRLIWREEGWVGCCEAGYLSSADWAKLSKPAGTKRVWLQSGCDAM